MTQFLSMQRRFDIQDDFCIIQWQKISECRKHRNNSLIIGFSSAVIGFTVIFIFTCRIILISFSDSFQFLCRKICDYQACYIFHIIVRTMNNWKKCDVWLSWDFILLPIQILQPSCYQQLNYGSLAGAKPSQYKSVKKRHGSSNWLEATHLRDN